MSLQLTDSFVEVANSKKIKTYQRDGLELPLEGVQEYIVIRANQIQAGQFKNIDLTSLEIPIRPLSLWIDSNAENRDAIDFEVLFQEQRIFKFSLAANKVPFIFPPLIITPELAIRVTPRYNIIACNIYCIPVKIVRELIAN